MTEASPWDSEAFAVAVFILRQLWRQGRCSVILSRLWQREECGMRKRKGID